MGIPHERRDGRSRFWSARPTLDPTMRLRIFGRIQPMDKPGLIERLFGVH